MKKHILFSLCLIFLTSIFLPACHTNKNTSFENTAAKARPLTFASDDEFLDFIQKHHLNYMWDGAEPTSGLARERIHIDQASNDSSVITTGGSGFGICGLLVGIERGFIPRKEGVTRFHKIVDYLVKADRFHGVWPHWIEGPTGKVKPFGQKDNGGDLVESAFLMQGLLCVRQYFRDGNQNEKLLAAKIDTLWQAMEWNWYLNGKDSLYWHWSPEYKWEMNFPLEGYNECLITYILGASSPTHPIPASAYHNGWARKGGIKSDSCAFGLPLVVKHNGAEKWGGPLFWAHYSYICLNPMIISDRYADYRQVTCNHALSNYLYCVENPGKFTGYGENCWGLTAGYSVSGYKAHAPYKDDCGVITPTAALSSFPYTPQESANALKYFYHQLGDSIWGKYGFYDGFSLQDQWFPKRYLAIDQCTIAPMIENYRSGFLWKLFMSCPEIQNGLEQLGFTVRPATIR